MDLFSIIVMLIIAALVQIVVLYWIIRLAVAGGIRDTTPSSHEEASGP